MGVYDTSFDKRTNLEAQIKCLGSTMTHYRIGDQVPVLRFGFPQNCTFLEWGGESKRFSQLNILGHQQYMGIFVVIRKGRLFHVTADETKFRAPVFTKYGECVLKQKVSARP